VFFVCAPGQSQGHQQERAPIPHADDIDYHTWRRFNAAVHLKFSLTTADMSNMQERRTEVRMMCADMVEVSWRDQHGKNRRAMAILEDISTTGACLQLEIPVPLDTEIRWDSPQHQFHGHVRYCFYREIGYFVGVELQPDSQWSRATYRPQHLLDPRRLVAQGQK
jgi:hypothetical protein